MCSKMCQYQATASYRAASTVIIRYTTGGESHARWLGHVRMESLGKITGLHAIEVPGITALEHHGKGFSLKSPVTVKGMVRDIGEELPALFIVTQSLLTKTGFDRWPILTSIDGLIRGETPDIQAAMWKDVIEGCWRIDDISHRSFEDFMQARGIGETA